MINRREIVSTSSASPFLPTSSTSSASSTRLNPAQPSPIKQKSPSPLRLPNTRHDRRREVSPLHSMDILLTSPSAIQSFANLVNSYPFTISLRQGRAVIDAKSILGIYSLDLLKPVTIEIYSIQPTELLRELERYGA